jgi:filamentous hemagglutinin
MPHPDSTATHNPIRRPHLTPLAGQADGPAVIVGTTTRSASWQHRLTARLAVFVLLFGQLIAPLAQAQQRVITDPTAPMQFKPSVGISGNGTPQIDITAPSAGGISHNKFKQYDIDARGVILNNSQSTGQSIIGGQVGANPNLIGSRPATVILNEVTGSTASTLAGATEVFGQRANVIIANPNGVGCVGCSFINTGTVTLSTGVPRPDYNTGNVLFDVTRGTVSVSGTGLLAAPGQTLSGVDLVGRQISVDAPVVTNGAARLIAGAGTFNAGSGAVAIPVDGTVLAAITGPAIQSSLAGTIKAGSVLVLSRDLNLGVEMLGNVEAVNGRLTMVSAGALILKSAESYLDMALAAAGDVTVRGNLQSASAISLSGRNVVLAADIGIMALSTIQMSASGTFTSDATFNAPGAITLVSTGDMAMRNGAIQSGAAVTLRSGANLVTDSLGVYGASVSATAAGLLQANNSYFSSGTALALVGRDVTLGENTSFAAPGAIALTASNLFTNATYLDLGTTPNLNVNFGTSLTNTATGTILDTTFTRTFSGDLINAGLIVASTALNVTAGTLTNETTGVIYSPSITLGIATAAVNHGQMIAETDFIFRAQSLTNTGQIASNRALDLTVINTLTNAGRIEAAQQVTVTAASLINQTFGVVTGPGVTLRGGQLSNFGLIEGLGVLDIALTSSLVNSGRMDGGQALLASAQSITNTATGQITAQQIALTTTAALTNAGRLIATDYLQATTGSLSNDGASAQISAQTVILQAQSTLTNTNAASIVSAASMTLQAAALSNSASISVGSADAKGGSLSISGVTTTSTVNGQTVTKLVVPLVSVTNSGTIVAADILSVTGQDIINQLSGSLSATNIGLTATNLTNDGSVVATGVLQIVLANSVTNRGLLRADGVMAITALTFLNAATGEIRSPGLYLDVSGTATNNGRIIATDRLQIAAQNLINQGSASQTATLQGKTVVIDVTGSLDNRTAATILATSATGISGLSLTAASLSNAGILQSGVNLVAVVQGTLSSDGDIRAGGIVDLTGTSLVSD